MGIEQLMKPFFVYTLQRMERLAASAGGGNIVTTKSWASMDDDTETLQRLNVILKVHCGFARV